MKKICLLLLFTPIWFYAQDHICHYKVNKINQIIKARVLKTDWLLLTKDKSSDLYFSLNRTGNQKYVVFKLNKDLGCTTSYSNNRSFVKVTLNNGDVITFNHFDDTNCDNFTLYGRLEKNDIIKLRRSRIKSIRLSGTKNNYYINHIENSNAFIRNLSCID
jgi:hypothetical protein